MPHTRPSGDHSKPACEFSHVLTRCQAVRIQLALVSSHLTRTLHFIQRQDQYHEALVRQQYVLTKRLVEDVGLGA